MDKCSNFKPTNRQLKELLKITQSTLLSKNLDDIETNGYIDIMCDLLDKANIILPDDFFDYPDYPEWFESYDGLIYSYICLLND